MKVTLHATLRHGDIEFEREAEYVYMTNAALTAAIGRCYATEAVVCEITNCSKEDLYLLLTPKKRKFWKFTAVKTFEEASSASANSGKYRYCIGDNGYLTSAVSEVLVQCWLSWTEHEE